MVRLAAVLSCALAAALPVPAFAQDEAYGVREFTQSGTWRVPAGVSRITIELWGAGGGGGPGGSAVVGGAAGPGGAGGGGGSGAYLRARLGVREGETYSVNIGAGGRGGRWESRDAPQAGSDGEDTAISRDGKVLFVAEGGRGGSAPKRLDIKGGSGGPGGAARPTPMVLVRAGDRGAPGETGLSDANSTLGGAGGITW